jgi:hypothetical protein
MINDFRTKRYKDLPSLEVDDVNGDGSLLYMGKYEPQFLNTRCAIKKVTVTNGSVSTQWVSRSRVAWTSIGI